MPRCRSASPPAFCATTRLPMTCSVSPASTGTLRGGPGGDDGDGVVGAHDRLCGVPRPQVRSDQPARLLRPLRVLRPRPRTWLARRVMALLEPRLRLPTAAQGTEWLALQEKVSDVAQQLRERGMAVGEAQQQWLRGMAEKAPDPSPSGEILHVDLECDRPGAAELVGIGKARFLRGVIGEAIWLDGKDSFVQLAQQASFGADTAFSLSAWIRLDVGALDGACVVIGKVDEARGDRGYVLELVAGARGSCWRWIWTRSCRSPRLRGMRSPPANGTTWQPRTMGRGARAACSCMSMARQWRWRTRNRLPRPKCRCRRTSTTMAAIDSVGTHLLGELAAVTACAAEAAQHGAAGRP
jgi:hypothetical protein